MSSPKYAREVGAESIILEREAAGARAAFKISPRSEKEDLERKRRLGIRFAVKGRLVPGGARLWDVFALDGDQPPRLAAAGFRWRAEAIACAADLLVGKTSISFGGLRGIFGRAGSLLSPERSIQRPGELAGRVTMHDTTDGGAVIQRATAGR